MRFARSSCLAAYLESTLIDLVRMSDKTLTSRIISTRSATKVAFQVTRATRSSSHRTSFRMQPDCAKSSVRPLESVLHAVKEIARHHVASARALDGEFLGAGIELIE